MRRPRSVRRSRASWAPESGSRPRVRETPRTTRGRHQSPIRPAVPRGGAGGAVHRHVAPRAAAAGGGLQFVFPPALPLLGDTAFGGWRGSSDTAAVNGDRKATGCSGRRPEAHLAGQAETGEQRREQGPGLQSRKVSAAERTGGAAVPVPPASGGKCRLRV